MRTSVISENVAHTCLVVLYNRPNMADGYTENNKIFGINIAMQRWLCFGRRCGLGSDGKVLKDNESVWSNGEKTPMKIVRQC